MMLYSLSLRQLSNKFMKSDIDIIILLYWSLISSPTRICPVQDIFLAVKKSLFVSVVDILT